MMRIIKGEKCPKCKEERLRDLPGNLTKCKCCGWSGEIDKENVAG